MWNEVFAMTVLALGQFTVLNRSAHELQQKIEEIT